MADVYISCDPSDAAIAEQFRKALNSKGISCHISSGDAKADTDSGKKVPAELLRAKYFVVLVSRRSLSCPDVRNELFQATEANRVILPVRLDNAPLNDTYHFYLGTRQWISGAWRLSAASRELCSVILNEPGASVPTADNADKQIAIRFLFCLITLGLYVVFISVSASVLRETNPGMKWNADGILSLGAIIIIYLTMAPAFGGYKAFLRTLLEKIRDAFRGE